MILVDVWRQVVVNAGTAAAEATAAAAAAAAAEAAAGRVFWGLGPR